MEAMCAMKALAAGIVGLLVVAGAAGAVYVGTQGGSDEVVVDQLPTATEVATKTPGAVTETPEQTPTPATALDVYIDESAAISIPYPKGNTTEERRVELPGKDGIPAATARQIIFFNDQRVVTMSVAIAPKPMDVGLKDWIKSIPGWPGDPNETTVDGMPALLFGVDMIGAANPTVYFEQDSNVVAIRGNVAGGEGVPGTMAEDDFMLIVASVDRQ
jgi:hypothetical protein